MSSMLHPSIILLKDGTDQSQGRAQVVSNINACRAVVDAVCTSLGPRGMDKLIQRGDRQVISNDGATIMNLLDVVHPAALMLVEVARAQDAEVGDGTTSVVVLAGALLHEAQPFVEDGVHPRIIIRGLRHACDLAIARLDELATPLVARDAPEFRTVLERCAGTAMNSKLVATHKALFARIVVDAVLALDDALLALDMIGIKKEPGGSLDDSTLVHGVAFKKTFSYAGFEQQPKQFDDCAVLALNVELELRAERDNAELRIKDPKQYQAFVDAEWRIIYEKLEKCVASGAKVILSRKAIGDLATQYFADRGLFCAGRVVEEDMRRVCAATGAQVQTSIHDLAERVLGRCGRFEERQVGKERYNFFTRCAAAKTATIMLRGGGEHFIDEADRSLHDAIMIVRRTLKSSRVVAGGGAIEMELSKHLRQRSRTIGGKQQLVVGAFAKALEVIPRQLAINAGFDPTDLLNQLRQQHVADDGAWFGVDIENEGIADLMKAHVWEPALVKRNALQAATEAACTILSIDETVKNVRAQPDGGPPPQGMPGGM